MRSSFGNSMRYGDLSSSRRRMGSPSATRTGVSSPASRTFVSPVRTSIASPFRTTPLRSATGTTDQWKSRSTTKASSTSPASKTVISSVHKNAVFGVDRFPLKPTRSEKHRIVFDEIDSDGKRFITEHDLRNIFDTLKINFTQPTVCDLFERADVSKSQKLNFSNFLSWAENYSTLVDAIYFRSRASVDRTTRVQTVDSAKVILGDLGCTEREALTDLEAVSAALAEQEAVVESNQNEVDVRSTIERESHLACVKAQQELENCRAARNNLERDLMVGQENERRNQRVLAEKQAVSNEIKGRLDETEANLVANGERERVLQAELQEVQHNVMQLTQAKASIVVELDEARAVEASLNQTQHDLLTANQELLTSICATEETIATAVFDDREARNAQAHAIAELRRIEAELAGNLNEQDDVKVRRVAAQERHASAARQVEMADAKVRQLENELAIFLESRAQAETAEQTLLEGEVRLREQRYNLDDRDGTHANESSKFNVSTTVSLGQSCARS